MTPDPTKTVFISYRRSVSSFIARAIFMDLRKHGYDVFMDVESIDSGAFDTIILNQIAARAHFLLILTPGTLERCDESGDWLRREIETAMDLGRNIVPLLIGDTKFDVQAKQCLTGKLADLPRLNALTVPHDYFDAAMDKLRNRFLKQPVYGAIQPTPIQDQAAVQQKINDAASQPKPTEDQMTAEQYYNQGYDCRENGDYEQAILYLNEAIRLNPQYADAYNNRGVAHANQGDQTAALADYTEALRIEPQFALAYNNRGNLYFDQGELERAITEYSAAIQSDPQLATAYYNRGNARLSLGDNDGAIVDYNAAIQLTPNDAMLYNNRAVAYERNGVYQTALANYDAALRLEPGHEFATNNRRDLIKKMQGNTPTSL